MSSRIERLPYDILFFVCTWLNLEDVVHLSYTSRQLNSLLQESTLCRMTVENQAYYSLEAKLIRQRGLSNDTNAWRATLLRVYERRRALANASPASAGIIGYGSDFCQRDGVLCFLSENRIVYVWNQLSDHGERHCIDLTVAIQTPEISHAGYKFSLLNYKDDLLVIHCKEPRSQSPGSLLILRTEKSLPDAKRILRVHHLETSTRLFVRHDRNYLYYGTHSGLGSDNHHEWQIRGISLRLEFPLPEEATTIQLYDFVGYDLGSTVVFEVHDGYFYALSNQTSIEVEEIDWTSFYRCVRFPLANPVKEYVQTKEDIYRRPHNEGPINDLWTDLSLQVDERTNDFVIVEARREWLRGGSRQFRTFYCQKLQWPSIDDPHSLRPEHAVIQAMETAPSPLRERLLPSDDPLTQVIDSSNNPHYSPPQLRKPEETHPEHGSCQHGETHNFPFAKTKFRGYDLSSSTFLDIVEDANCCTKTPLTPCLRLRIGSRRLRPEPNRPPFVQGVSSDIQASYYEHPEPEKQFITDRHRYTPIRLWPPSPKTTPQTNCKEQCPTLNIAHAHNIMNPPRGAASTTACCYLSSASFASLSPERSSGSNAGHAYSSRYRHISASLSSSALIYHVRFAKDSVSPPEGEGAIVCVAFDKHIKFQGASEVWQNLAASRPAYC